MYRQSHLHKRGLWKDAELKKKTSLCKAGCPLLRLRTYRTDNVLQLLNRQKH